MQLVAYGAQDVLNQNRKAICYVNNDNTQINSKNSFNIYVTLKPLYDPSNINISSVASPL